MYCRGSHVASPSGYVRFSGQFARRIIQSRKKKPLQEVILLPVTAFFVRSNYKIFVLERTLFIIHYIINVLKYHII